jgi:hypothetical protein
MSVFNDNITAAIPTRDALQTALDIIVSKCADYIRNVYPNKFAEDAYRYADIMDAIEIVAFRKKLAEELEARHGLLEAIHPRIIQGFKCIDLKVLNNVSLILKTSESRFLLMFLMERLTLFQVLVK